MIAFEAFSSEVDAGSREPQVRVSEYPKGRVSEYA